MSDYTDEWLAENVRLRAEIAAELKLSEDLANDLHDAREESDQFEQQRDTLQRELDATTRERDEAERYASNYETVVGDRDRLRTERDEARMCLETSEEFTEHYRARVKVLEGLLEDDAIEFRHLNEMVPIREQLLSIKMRLTAIDAALSTATSEPNYTGENVCSFCGTVNDAHHSAECVDRRPCSTCGGSREGGEG